MEIWDGYKKDGSLAGCDLIRGEPIPTGLFHLVCEITVRHIDGSYLLMQRDFGKKDYPGMFEATAGGSALKGETPLCAALRELKEETGIVADKLKQISITLSEDTIYYNYLCITGCEKSAVTLQEGETIAFRWIPEDEFLIFINSEDAIPLQKIKLKEYCDNINLFT